MRKARQITFETVTGDNGKDCTVNGTQKRSKMFRAVVDRLNVGEIIII